MFAAPHAMANGKKQERQSTISETFKATKRTSIPSKKAAAASPRSPVDGTKASPAKRKKKAATPAVHPQLATPTYDHYDQEAEAARKFYETVESCAQHIRSLGLPANYEQIQLVLCDPHQSFEAYIAHLQQPFPSPASINSSPVGAQHRALLAGQYAAAQHASRMQQAQVSPSAVTTPVRTALAMPTPSPAARPAFLHQVNHHYAPRPGKLVFTIDGQGRAELSSRNTPTPPPIAPSTPRSIFAEPKAQVIAAEVEGMGRVVTEWSVLVDRLGAARASVAEARARGTIVPGQMASGPSYEGHQLPGSLAFAESGRPRRAFPPAEDDDARIVAERNERIQRWLSADDDEDGVEEPPLEEAEILETVVVSGKSVRSLQRVKRRREDEDDEGEPFDVTPLATPTKPSKPRTRASTRATSRNAHEEGDTSCICQQGEIEGADMVQCESCINWFHLQCLELDARDLPDHWVCHSCLGDRSTVFVTPAGGLEDDMEAEPTFTHAAFTPRVGHFSRGLAPEIALAPSPVPAFGRHARISGGYSPRSPSTSRTSSYNFGQRRRLQSGAFDDPMPYRDDDDVEGYVMPAWVHSTPANVPPPVSMAVGPTGKPIYPSTPSRYVYKSADGLTQSMDPTPPSTIDGGSHSRSSSSADRRFSFPSTPTISGQDLFAPFESLKDFPSFSPICDTTSTAAAHFYRQRYHSVSRDLMAGSVFSSANGGQQRFGKPSMASVAHLPTQAWGKGPLGSSTAFAKAVMSGPPSTESMARTASGLGIGFEAAGDAAELVAADY